jgi:hypothetical protein
MLNCAHCQTQLDDDSFFCDQCGKEVFICTECGKTGIGKRCIHDGKPLVAAQAKASGLIIPPPPVPVSVLSAPVSMAPAPPAAPSGSATLTLVNNSLNLRISVQDGDVIGRNQGQHTAIFGQHGSVSGKHAQFTYDRLQNAWFVTDLNSTNHTRIGMSPNWSAIAPLQPQKPTLLQHGQYLLIAQLEFLIQIEGASPPAEHTPSPIGTIRIV